MLRTPHPGEFTMNANPVKNAVVIESVENCENITFLTVDLGGGEHWDMYQSYCRLPNVVEHNGKLFGKSCWNSDNGRAYYRSDLKIAIGK